VSSSELVIQDTDDGVRTIRLNRPDRLNALTPEMVSGLTAAVAVDRSCRAIVITGVGRGFCAGVDIAGAEERQRGRSNADALAMQERFAGMILAIARSGAPVVAAVNGPVAGAGLAIALASDIRMAATTARFIIGAPTIGLSAGECGITYFLPRIIGLGRAAEIMLTNRPVLAEEAHAIGLVTSLTEPDDLAAAVDRTVREITAYSPFGQRMTKQVYRSTIDAPSLEAALEVENRTQILANGSEDAAEARRAFLEKRRPVWTGR
jgi:enoyl-CoA hydratase